MCRAATIIALTLLVLISAASAGKRDKGEWKSFDSGLPPSGRSFALVIGNGGYTQIPALRNPINDARAMDRTLRELGFEVIRLEDATKLQMQAGLRQLTASLGPDTVSLVYYAGHGLQMGDRNYLIPVDAQIGTAADLPTRGVELYEILGEISRPGGRVNIVILDACRDNPFNQRQIDVTAERSRGGQLPIFGDNNLRAIPGGLAPVSAPRDILIAYATAPGSVAADGAGANGLYTTELIRALVMQAEVEDVFKEVRRSVRQQSNGRQTPWEASSLTTHYWFHGRQ
jgi:uncharacterized caspase-like protein